MFVKYEHKATLDAHNQERGTPNGAQTAATQKIGRKHPINKLRGISPQANYTDRPSDRHFSAKLVPTFCG
jgi:hypothetical protein